jgi:hypothetical protein
MLAPGVRGHGGAGPGAGTEKAVMPGRAGLSALADGACVPEGRPRRSPSVPGMGTSEEVISEERCWELLATASVGRLALSVQALPLILPVQYYLDGRKLAVCLGHHEIPERDLDDAIIAFAADAVDPATRSGWSVQVQGRSTIPLQHGFDTACGRPTAGAGRADRARHDQRSPRAHVPVHRCSPGGRPGAPSALTGVRSRAPAAARATRMAAGQPGPHRRCPGGAG